MNSESPITITLTPDQALVFFEWLSREDDRRTLPTEHQSEQNVLWEIEAQLERTLVEPLQTNYATLLAAARARLTSKAGGKPGP